MPLPHFPPYSQDDDEMLLYYFEHVVVPELQVLLADFEPIYGTVEGMILKELLDQMLTPAADAPTWFEAASVACAKAGYPDGEQLPNLITWLLHQLPPAEEAANAE